MAWQKWDEFVAARDVDPLPSASEIRAMAKARYWRELLCSHGTCSVFFDPRNMKFMGEIGDPDCRCHTNR